MPRDGNPGLERPTLYLHDDDDATFDILMFCSECCLHRALSQADANGVSLNSDFFGYSGEVTYTVSYSWVSLQRVRLGCDYCKGPISGVGDVPGGSNTAVVVPCSLVRNMDIDDEIFRVSPQPASDEVEIPLVLTLRQLRHLRSSFERDLGDKLTNVKLIPDGLAARVLRALAPFE